jgi:hypothetical protein
MVESNKRRLSHLDERLVQRKQTPGGVQQAAFVSPEASCWDLYRAYLAAGSEPPRSPSLKAI